MSACDSSTEETLSAIIEQCQPQPVQIKARKTTKPKSTRTRQQMSAQELEKLRKYDKERKRERRKKITQAQRQRENERKRLQRLKTDKIDEIRAKEAAIKRNFRKNMPLDKLQEFRAKDAERKRLARQKMRMKTQAATTTLKPHSKKKTNEENVETTKPLRRGRSRKSKDTEEVIIEINSEVDTKLRRGKSRKSKDTEEVIIEINSEVDAGESCELGKIIDCYKAEERIKELQAVLNDLLEDQAEVHVGENNSARNQKDVCEYTMQDRAEQLEDQIWQLLDKQEEIEVKSDEVITIEDSSEEFAQLEEQISKLIHTHYEGIEELISSWKV